MQKYGQPKLKTGLAVMMLSGVMGLSGCATFLAQGTGPAPLGTGSGIRTFSQVLNDSSIERTSKVNMYKLDERFKYARININSFHSAVLLTGQVKDQYLKQLAEDNIKAMSDAKTVHNYITIGEKIPYNIIVQDSVVTANIRRMLVSSPEISDTKVKVHTEDGVVYIMGKLTTAENKVLINIVQNTPNIVKVVSLIDILTDSGASTADNALSQSGATSSFTPTPTAAAVSLNDETPVAIDPEDAAPDQSEQMVETQAP